MSAIRELAQALHGLVNADEFGDEETVAQYEQAAEAALARFISDQR